MSQVLFQHVSEAKNKKASLKPIILKIVKNLSVLSLVSIVLFQFFGEELFTFVFGSQWQVAAELAKILIFSYAIKFIVSPMSIILTAFEKLKIVAIWQVIYFIMMMSMWFLEDIELFDFIRIVVVVDLTSYLLYLFLILSYSIRTFVNGCLNMNGAMRKATKIDGKVITGKELLKGE